MYVANASGPLAMPNITMNNRGLCGANLHKQNDSTNTAQNFLNITK